MKRFNVVVYESDDFKMTGEVIDDNIFLHCDVKRNTHNVLKKIRTCFDMAKEQIKESGWKFVFTYTENPRWVKLFNGTYVTTIEDEGKKIGVYVWAL